MIDFKLYAITDRRLCKPKLIQDYVASLLDTGVRAIQLREKDLSDTELRSVAVPINHICKAYSAKLFINSNINIATDVGVDGVHLPESLLDTIQKAKARNLLVGCSVHDLDVAQKMQVAGANFVTYSPIYPTMSKPNPAVGLKSLKRIVGSLDIPVFALGGITPSKVPECLNSGAFGVAAMSSVMSYETGIDQAKNYLKQIEEY
ncbi:MAG: thiamine phosphate synthase [Candidatus Poribacteria bacterium]|nr:thiamine phosphate synthase [Candidatus Poribacteria bacterium]